MFKYVALLCGLIFATLYIMGGRSDAPVRQGLQGAYAPLALERADAPDPVVAVTEVAAAPPAPAPAPVAPQAQVQEDIVTATFTDSPEPRVTLALPLVDAAAPRTEVAEPVAEPVIQYVLGSSVNVRAGPSAQTEALTRLNRGEAVVVLPSDTPGWSMIRIEGDGVEGFIATRFLGEAPQDGLFGAID